MSANLSADELFDRHRGLMRLVTFAPPPPKLDHQGTNDIEILARHYRFVMPDGEQGEQPSTWETRMAKRYYDKLFKEYALADMSRYEEGKIGLRWRTEKEVVEGKGQFTCGNKRCGSQEGLCSYELNFKYVEHGTVRNELVKVRTCVRCTGMLFHNKSSQHRDAARAQRMPPPPSSSSLPPPPPSALSKRGVEEGGDEARRPGDDKRQKVEADVGGKGGQKGPLFPMGTRRDDKRSSSSSSSSSSRVPVEQGKGDDVASLSNEGGGGGGDDDDDGDAGGGDGLTATTRLTEEEAEAFIRDLLL